MVEPRLAEIRKVRLEKVKKLRDLGINPYPSKAKGNSEKISDALNSLDEVVEVSGRIMAWREHGNVIFADLKDETDQIQLWFQKNTLGDKFKTLKLIDIGDFLYAKGKVVKTQAGEVTVDAVDFQLLTKSIRPLPSAWYGLKDEEERYRQRYVDLILNQNLKSLFKKKAVFWQSMRNFLIDKGFLEVETPVLENTAGGADANPFVTHHEALDINLYLRISMGELWQKRLMVAGFEKTFEIGRQFRNEGLSREHLQDYTQMEFYWAYANYEDGMTLVEEMYKYVAQKTFGSLNFKILNFDIDLGKNWERIDYTQTIKEKTGIDIANSDRSELSQKLTELKIEFDKGDSKARLIDTLWKNIRKDIQGPAFLTGHPVEISPLSKRTDTDPNITERYQVILAGSEMGNGYSELNDPVDQADRFKKQQKMRDSGDLDAQMEDNDFVRALEYGMPPTTGFGVSERLFSFLADLPIRETVLFPLLRPENSIISVGQDVNHKLVIVIDRSLPAWQVMNTSAHAAAFLGNKMTEKFDTGKYFVTKDGVNLPRNSQYPIITLSATKDQLKKLISKVRDSGLLYIGYVPDMMKTTDDNKLAKTLSEKDDSQIDYVGVGIFGENSKVEVLTKDLPLWE